jgi:hypothetical protein
MTSRQVGHTPKTVQWRVLIGVEPPIAGVTFTLRPGLLSRGFYYDEEGRWDPDLPETTSLGLGGFTKVQGLFLAGAEVRGDGLDCTVGTWGWPPEVSSPNTVDF